MVDSIVDSNVVPIVDSNVDESTAALRRTEYYGELFPYLS
jgi:hypothetical protein